MFGGDRCPGQILSSWRSRETEVFMNRAKLFLAALLVIGGLPVFAFGVSVAPGVMSPPFFSSLAAASPLAPVLAPLVAAAPVSDFAAPLVSVLAAPEAPVLALPLSAAGVSLLAFAPPLILVLASTSVVCAMVLNDTAASPAIRKGKNFRIQVSFSMGMWPLKRGMRTMCNTHARAGSSNGMGDKSGSDPISDISAIAMTPIYFHTLFLPPFFAR